MRRRSETNGGIGRGHQAVVVLVGVLMLAAACSSEAPPAAAPPRTGSGAQEEGLAGEAASVTKAGTFVLKGLANGVLEGVGTLAFNWVFSLISPDKTPQKLADIQKGVDEIERNVQQLNLEVTSMRASMDQDFKNQQGVIQDAGVEPDRKVIDDATSKLQTFTADTKRALAAGTELPRINDYIGAYGDPRNLSDLYNLLDHDLDTSLTVGGSNTGGGSLIGTADTIFAGQQAQAEAAKTAAAFDDRPLWARLGLSSGATPDEITTACDDLHARQPDSAVCASNGTGGSVANVSYYDRMQTFIDYYINYQANGLLVVTTALYAWDDGGRCPVPAQGECAIATERAQEITTTVIENVRGQLARAGSPVSTDAAVLEIGTGDTASLWSTTTTSATWTQTPPSIPPNGWTDWRVSIDCTRTGQVGETNRPDEGIPCAVRNNPYVVAVPSEAPDAQICVGAPAIGTTVAARQPANGVYDALPAEWAACARPEGAAATGLRVPTHLEMQSALAKKPETWIESLGDPAAETTFGAGTYLSSTPAQVVCGVAVGDDQEDNWLFGTYTMSAINVNFDKWINGRAETWSRTTAWQPTPTYSWAQPLTLAFDSSGQLATAGYPADGPCERVEGDLGSDGREDNLLPRGFVQCVKNPSLVRDWCYGHRNYKGADLPAAGGQLRVWAVHSLVGCPGQKTDEGTGRRPAAWEVAGCEPDQRPTGRDWEIPGCKTAADRWTRCGTAWVDQLLPAPPAPVTTTTTTTSPSTTAPPVPTTAIVPSSSTSSVPTTAAPAVPTTVAATPPTTPAPAPTTTTAAPAPSP